MGKTNYLDFDPVARHLEVHQKIASTEIFFNQKGVDMWLNTVIDLICDVTKSIIKWLNKGISQKLINNILSTLIFFW